jgi:hypothetical protein
MYENKPYNPYSRSNMNNKTLYKNICINPKIQIKNIGGKPYNKDHAHFFICNNPNKQLWLKMIYYTILNIIISFHL